MGRFFWLIIGLAGILLILLISSGDTQSTFGFETDQLAVAGVSALWAILIGSAVFGNGLGFGETIKQLTIWVVIILGLMAGYVFRYDLQDIASRFTGGIIPGSPISVTNDDGSKAVTLIRSDNGHFEAVADVNNGSIRFLVDTGATSIVLSARDATSIGINVQALSFAIPTQTANGIGYAARTRIETFDLGGIKRTNLRVMVAEPGRMNQSLLGQQFLESLSSYEKRGNQLTLRD